jgi:hypothetical protein
MARPYPIRPSVLGHEYFTRHRQYNHGECSFVPWMNHQSPSPSGMIRRISCANAIELPYVILESVPKFSSSNGAVLHQGLKIWPIFLKITEIRRNMSTELKNCQILKFKFIFFEKLKNCIKKLDQIIRILVNKIFHVLLDKIQIL